jgi:hypothetical protein
MLCDADPAFTISDSTLAKYRIVTADTSATPNAPDQSLPTLKGADANTDHPIGVTLEEVTATAKVVPVRCWGITKLEVNGGAGAIDIGTKIVAGTGGKGVAAAAAGAADQEVLGTALGASSADGDVISVLLRPHTLVKGTA